MAASVAPAPTANDESWLALRFISARILLLLTLAAFGMRLFRLDTGLWLDEIYALDRSFRVDLATNISTYWGDAHHPLYSLLARLSLVLFGESAWSVRLPAALAGTLAVPMAYALARRVTDAREGLCTALLLAVSYHHVWFSQNARGYTLMALLALASTWAILRAMETRAPRYYMLYAGTAALAAYTHLTMVFVAAGHAAVVAIELIWPEGGRSRADWRWPAGAFLAAALLTVLLYAPMMSDVLDFFLNHPSGLRGVSTPGWAAQEAIRSLLIGFGATKLAAGVVGLAGLALVAIAGFASIASRHRNAALAFSVPVLAVLLGALASRGTMYPRFFFFLIGIALIVLVRGMFAVAVWVARQRASGRADRNGARLAVAGVGVLAVASVVALGFNYRFPKQDYAGAVQFVQSGMGPGDHAVFAGVPGEPLRVLFGLAWPTVTTETELANARRGARTWLLYTFPRYLASGAPEVANVVAKECPSPRVFRGSIGGGDVYVCLLEPGS